MYFQLPRPDQYMISPVQSDKTRAIFQNMERGLIIGVEHINDSSQFGIPDVYVNRLCQTRVSHLTIEIEHMNNLWNGGAN